MAASTIFETQLGRSLEEALETRKDEDVARVVTDIIDGIWPRNFAPEELQDIVVELQKRSQFEHVVAISDAAMAVGRATVETRRRYSQALIELGALHAAELELNRILEDDEASAKEKGEALGLLGRLGKQRFVAGHRGSDLREAMEWYLKGYDGRTDTSWHGVNLIALMHRAARDGIAVPPNSPDVEELADEILAEVRQKPENQRNIWQRNVELESLVALGKLDEARAVAESLAETENVDDFELRSLRRQLLEVWEIESTSPLILAINDRALTIGRQATLELPESSMQLEKILGTALPIGYKNLMKGLRAAESVCKITDAAGEGWGTGFLLKGSLIHESLGDGPILVTNAHVVSSIPGMSQLQAAEIEAHFEVTKGIDGEPLVIKDLTEIWSSPIAQRDVTLLRFDTEIPELPQPIEAAPVLPPKTEGAFVYVIGHPAGGGVKFSIRGNDLLGYDSDEVKVHYTAPTEGGSSGSPVFTSAWQLMALHHAGNSQMKRLDDPSKTYKANEGITIDSIRAEFAATMNQGPVG